MKRLQTTDRRRQHSNGAPLPQLPFTSFDHWRYKMKSISNQPRAPQAAPIVSRDSMRILGEQAGRNSLKDLKGCVDPAAAFEGWRAHCRAELVEEHKDHPDVTGLVTAWEKAFDSVQPIGLAPKEMALLKAYRLADERGRESIYEIAVSEAEDWPRYTFSAPLPEVGGAA